MRKVEIRKKIMSIMKDMDQSTHTKKSSSIIDRLCESEEFTEAEIIAITISRFPEVETRTLIENAWKLGKQVVVPKCIPSSREMDFRLISSFEDLETVYMDLLEPISEQTKSIDKSHINLQIVPGVVFSKDGYRIGFGGGYYDRYLRDYNGKRISLAFEVQIEEEVPVEKHDIPVDLIITETGTIECWKFRKDL